MKKMILLLFFFEFLNSCALIEQSREARVQNQRSTPATLDINPKDGRYSSQPNLKPKVVVRRSYVNFNKDGAQSSKYSEESSRVAYELGLDPKAGLSAADMEAVETRIKVRELERRLDSKKEKEQYSKVLPVLASDKEKLAFLSIPSIEGRQAWINKNSIFGRMKTASPEMRDVMETQDIALNMPMDFVKKAWGEPAAIEVSGNPIYRNERWKYSRYVSTPDGYRSEKRWVYFEGGKVVGWETD